MADWTITVEHDGLNASRVITGNNKRIVEEKAEKQRHQWNREWTAVQWTAALNSAYATLSTLLASVVKQSGNVAWDGLKIERASPESQPETLDTNLPPEPEPSRFDAPFNQQPLHHQVIHLLRQIFGYSRRFSLQLSEWERARQQFAQNRQWHESELAGWTARRDAYLAPQVRFNKSVSGYRDMYETARRQYLNGITAAAGEYLLSRLAFDALQWQRPRVLKNNPQPLDAIRDLPNQVLGEFSAQINWRAENGIFLIDYTLPSRKVLPELRAVRYVKTGDKLDFVKLRQAEVDAKYNDLLYQICLRTIHILYASDEKNSIKSIVFNGWVNFVDNATGIDTTACIMTIQANREAFLALHLDRVEPRACFRMLKGISAAQLHEMIPVAPILRGRMHDPRFVESREIADHLRKGTNIAAIGWEDFEHLIRELFDKEFSRYGGQVKVTPSKP